MSILFDALKRAQGRDDGVTPPDSPPSEPFAAMPSAINPAEFIQVQEDGAAAARAIFSATSRLRRNIVPFAVVGIALLLVGVGGAWWWFSQHSQSQLIPQHPAPTTAPVTMTTAAPGPIPQVPPASLVPAAPEVAAVEQALTETMLPAQETADKTSSTKDEPAVKKAKPKTGPARQTPQSRPPEKDNTASIPEADNPSTVHILLGTGVDPLKDGYDALKEGRLDDAEQKYLEVIAKRPQEKDALLGLAVIAHRKLQTKRASDLYQQVLREDPGNAFATAALVNLSAQVDPVAAESRLKQLLDLKPTASELHHALGSVLARQNRWGEAEQTFFRAYSLEPDNAFYAYNLAVALDHLRKPAAALPYYEKSARLARPGDVAIDRDIIQRRVQELRNAQ